MKNYFLTVGQKYRDEPHPLNLHPDGYARIVAPNYECARAAVVKACGAKWAFIYQDDEFDFVSYPRGELDVITHEE